MHADRTCEKHHNGGFTNDQKESHAEENTRPPKINFALFAPQMAFAQNLELPLGSCFLAAMNESLAADFGQQTIFVHNPPNAPAIVMLTVLSSIQSWARRQPYVYTFTPVVVLSYRGGDFFAMSIFAEPFT